MTQPIQNRKSKIQNIGLPLLLLAYIAIALAHAAFAPLTTGPDELAHYEYVNFIAEHGRLPLDNAERSQASYKSDQPPLYHLLAAIPAASVDPTGPPFLKRVGDHPRRQLIERTRHAWGLYNTADEQWPYRAEVLRWHLGRWVAILFGAATVAMTFFVACDVFSRSGGEILHSPPHLRTSAPLLALTAAAVVAFIPRFALTGSMLNYETLLAVFSALFLWVLIRLTSSQPPRATRYESRFTSFALWVHAFLLGLCAGLAITAKLSAIILPVEIVLGLWLVKRANGWPWSQWWRGVLTAALGTLLAVSWWFGFILYQFNTVATDGWWTGLLRPLIAADASDATTNRLLSFLTGGQAGFTGAIDNLDSGPPWAWASIFFRTFWTARIEEVQPLGWVGLAVALLLCALATWSLVTGHWSPLPYGFVTGQNQTLRPTRLVLSLLLLHLFLPVLLPLLRYATTFSLADTAQGRHVLFAAAPAFAILLVWGLANYQPTRQALPIINPQGKRYQLSIPALAPLFLFIWTLTQLWTMTWAYLPPLPVRTGPEARAQVSHSLDLALNDYVTLAGYNQTIEDDVLQLDLFWQSTAISPVDYLTEINLVDATGQTQRHWLGHPAQGRYPTRAWDVGDLVRDTIWLPLAYLPQGDYQISLDLIATNLHPPDPAPVRLPTSLPLTQITVPDSSQSPISNLQSPQLWQDGHPITTPTTFRYRESIFVTLPPPATNQQRAIEIIGPAPLSNGLQTTDSPLIFSPVLDRNDTTLFIVGPDWPTGDYQLQVTEAGEPQPIPNTTFTVIDRWERQFTEPPMQRRVEANFANRVQLLGYDLGANRAEPGGGIPITLYWRGLDWMGTDYTIFSKLIAADGSVHGGRDRLPREGYSTLYWAPGEIISDPFGLPVDPNAPDGIYTIHLGLYQQVGEQAVSLPLVQDGQRLDTTSLTIGPIKIGQANDFTLDTANPQVTLNQPFGPDPNLTLLGFDQLPITNYQSTGQALPITLYWRSDSPLPLDYTTFIHLRDAAGNVVAQKDQPPLDGAYPTSLWDPGEIIADQIVVPLPPELPAGTYTAVVGLYDLQTGQRLAVPDSPENEVTLTTVEPD